jgi:hypothetical protein
MRVHVNTLSSKNYTFDLDPDDSLGKVRLLIREQNGMPLENQKIIFKGNQIEDGMKSLADFGIVDGSTLHFVYDFHAGFTQIFAKDETGATFSLGVKYTYNIEILKTQLMNFTVRPIKLLYRGEELHDDKLVGHYGIVYRDTLDIVYI